MYMSIFVIVIILAMGYFWGAQGGFSALLHLIATVLAGVFSFALFDSLGPLFGQEAGNGIALYLVFGLSLLIIRNVMNFFVPNNVELPVAASWSIGVISGLLSGILTTGIICIGLLHFPYLAASAGYLPYGDEGKQVVANPKSPLWLPSDRMTAKFYSTISNGSFNPFVFGEPINNTHPDIIASSARHMMVEGKHEGMLHGVDPDAVNITKTFQIAPVTSTLAERFMFGEGKETDTTLVAITTSIALDKDGNFNTSVVDKDNIFRVKPQQVVLTYRSAEKRFVQVSPVGFMRDNMYSHFRRNFAWARTSSEITWVFQLPEGAKPLRLRIKQASMKIYTKEMVTRSEEVLALGASGNLDLFAKSAEDKDVPFIKIQRDLPFRIALDYASTDRAEKDARNRLATYEGRELDKMDEKDKSNHFRYFAPKTEDDRIVRVHFNAWDTQRIFGSLRRQHEIAESIPYLVDSEGNQIFPVGWAALTEKRDKMDLYYNVLFDGQYTSMKQMKFTRTKGGRHFEMYFSIAPSTTLKEFRFPQAFNESNIDLKDYKVKKK